MSQSGALPDSPASASTGRKPRGHLWLRLAVLALVCALLQAWQPSYWLGSAGLVPLALLLGVMVASALTRGPATLPAALLGTALGAWLGGGWGPAAWLLVPLLGLQTALVLALMRRHMLAGGLLLDSGAGLQRLVLVAAPAAALLGALGSLVAAALEPGIGLVVAWSRPALAHGLGRLVVDWAGIVVVCSIMLCWLARPLATWRPRRRLVALPLALTTLMLLPGLDEVARRDELRLKVRFEREALARQRQLQQLLAEPAAAVAAARGMLAAGGSALSDAQFEPLAAGWTSRVGGLKALGWLQVTGDNPPALSLPHAHLAATPGSAGAVPVALRQAVATLAQQAGVAAAVARALMVDGPATALLEATGPSATPWMLLVQAVPNDPSRQRRLAFGVVELQGLLESVLPDADDPNLRVCVFDQGANTGVGTGKAESGQTAMASAPVASPLVMPLVLAGPAACAAAPSQAAFRVEAGRLNLSDRSLSVLSIEPPSADNRLFTSVWLLGLPSMLGMGLLATLLLAITGRLQRIEQRVQERTAALQTEVNERRQAEQALATSEQRFRAMFESVNIGVTLVDRQGVIQMANPAFCSLMACSTETLVGQPLVSFKLPDVVEDDGTAQALGGEQARRQRYLTADGRVLQVAASLRTLHDASGEAVGTVGALQDLTQMLRLRDAERARDEADVANRTKSEFLARLGHELRTPLNAIIGFTQMVDDADRGADEAPKLQRSLARIRQAGWHLLDMVNDVLDLSRLEAGTLRLRLAPVALPELIDEALAMLEPAAQKAQVQLRLSLSPQAEWVRADALRLRQVLINLVGNAIKYNHAGGWVQLRTRPAGLGDILIEVEDNGPGLSDEQQQRLFQSLPRLDGDQAGRPGSAAEQGTGIGLVICQRLTRLMGGELEVHSQAGQGSVFSLRLPKAGHQAQARAAPSDEPDTVPGDDLHDADIAARPAPSGRPEGSHARPSTSPAPAPVSAPASPMAKVSIGQVLYVEDDEADVAALRALLAQRPGISLTCVPTAAQGLVLAHQADVLLLDLDLPDLPGLSLLAQLQADERLRRLPVIVVSAETRPDRIDACFDAGAAAFFSKPLDPAPLLRALDEALQAP